MGRKPNVSKVLVLEKPPMPESTYPSLERSEPLSGNSNPSLNRVDSHLENQNSPCPALKYQNPSAEGTVSHDERSPAQEKENGKVPEVQEKSSTYRRRKSKYHASAVRRSQRFKSAVACTSDHDIEPYDEDITFIDNQKDEPDTQMGKVLSEPEANLGDKGLLGKLNFILRRLEAFEKTIESLQSKVVENAGLDETPSSSSTVYKSMYLDSEKKIEALTDENRQLTGKLENALGKVEVLEKQSNVLIEVLEKMKDVALISGLAKSTEAAVNASTQAVRNACTASAAKRKRHAQES